MLLKSQSSLLRSGRTCLFESSSLRHVTEGILSQAGVATIDPRLLLSNLNLSMQASQNQLPHEITCNSILDNGVVQILMCKSLPCEIT